MQQWLQAGRQSRQCCRLCLEEMQFMSAGWKEAGSPGKVADYAWKRCSSCLLGVRRQAVQARLQTCLKEMPFMSAGCNEAGSPGNIADMPERDAVHACWVWGGRQSRQDWRSCMEGMQFMSAGCEVAGSPSKVADRAWKGCSSCLLVWGSGSPGKVANRTRKGCSSCLLGARRQAAQVRLQIVHGRDAVHVCWVWGGRQSRQGCRSCLEGMQFMSGGCEETGLYQMELQLSLTLSDNPKEPV